MPQDLTSFAWDDSGAVTVDWVVLTAATVGISVMVMLPFGLAAGSTVRSLAAYILSIEDATND